MSGFEIFIALVITAGAVYLVWGQYQEQKDRKRRSSGTPRDSETK